MFSSEVQRDVEPVLERFELAWESGTPPDIDAYLRISTGQPLNRLQKGEYQIRLTGALLRSNDPKDP